MDELFGANGPTCCFCKNISKIMRDFAIVSGSWPVKVVSPMTGEDRRRAWFSCSSCQRSLSMENPLLVVNNHTNGTHIILLPIRLANKKDTLPFIPIY